MRYLCQILPSQIGPDSLTVIGYSFPLDVHGDRRFSRLVQIYRSRTGSSNKSSEIRYEAYASKPEAPEQVSSTTIYFWHA